MRPSVFLHVRPLSLLCCAFLFSLHFSPCSPRSSSETRCPPCSLPCCRSRVSLLSKSAFFACLRVIRRLPAASASCPGIGCTTESTMDELVIDVPKQAKGGVMGMLTAGQVPKYMLSADRQADFLRHLRRTRQNSDSFAECLPCLSITQSFELNNSHPPLV